MLLPGLQELVLVIVIIMLLSATGLWPRALRILRELRGQLVDEGPPPSRQDLEVASRLLGVSPTAPWEEVKRAYRRKAKVHHPDRGGDEDAMRALNEAYALMKRRFGKR